MFGFLDYYSSKTIILSVTWTENSKVRSGKIYKCGCQQHVLGMSTDRQECWRPVSRLFQHLQVETRRRWKDSEKFSEKQRNPMRVGYLTIQVKCFENKKGSNMSKVSNSSRKRGWKLTRSYEKKDHWWSVKNVTPRETCGRQHSNQGRYKR